MSNSVAKLTDKQQAFLDFLKDPAIQEVPARSKFRWAATKAGYSEDTAMSLITRGITKEITQVAEELVMQASISAAFVLQDTVNGDNIEGVKTKFMLDAAHAILDRAVPKKEAVVKQQGPLVQILLPAKADIKQIEVIDG